MAGKYMNDPGYEVPDNHILAVPHSLVSLLLNEKDPPDNNGYYEEVILPLAGIPKRDWFNEHFYYCLPINIGNQYGFVIRSLVDFDAIWNGGEQNAIIKLLDENDKQKQTISGDFGCGIITIQNRFALKTPPGINIMTIQPPNMFIPTCVAMTGVIETDNIRRDFTFNLKMTLPGHVVKVRKGDPLGAFIPIPRNFVENFKVVSALDVFPIDIVKNDMQESVNLSAERQTIDTAKPHQSGRRYFSGTHTDGTKYTDHQKRVIGPK